MRPILFASLTVTLFFACQSPKDIPNDVYSVAKMQPIMLDLLRADALSSTQFGKDSAILTRKKMEAYDTVFAIYKITREDFFHSYDYYLSHPDKNKILMDSVNALADRKRLQLFQKVD